MNNTSTNIFCFFSGFLADFAYLLTINRNVDNSNVIIHVKINKKIPLVNYVQLDGNIFLVTKQSLNQLVLMTELGLFEKSALSKKSPGDPVHLGILSSVDSCMHPIQWTLHPSTTTTVQLRNNQVAKGHKYTLEMIFEAPLSLQGEIITNQHIGIAGISLTPQKVTILSDKVEFSIYCGKETQENTCFNTLLKPGTFLDFTSGHKMIEFRNKNTSEEFKHPPI